MFKAPKDTDKFSWTKHAIEKMKFYGLSPQRVLRIVNKPERCEQAVVEGCLACMQTVGKKRKTEIWMMYQDIIISGKKKRKIITAWRYPGVSPKRDMVPIPEEILKELGKVISNQ